MKKFIIAAVLVTGIATPAFAQSFDPDNGTGNIVWRHAPVTQNGAVGQNGDSSYASAPKMGFEGNGSIKTDDLGRTGGGSPGYNETLKQY
jgi:opacity protein-like surface antigen